MRHYHIKATLHGTKKFYNDVSCDIMADVWAATEEEARQEVLDYDYTDDPRCPYNIAFHEPCIITITPLDEDDGEKMVEVYYERYDSIEDLLLDPDAIYERRVLGL